MGGIQQMNNIEQRAVCDAIRQGALLIKEGDWESFYCLGSNLGVHEVKS